jgi:hypothetical protein
MPQLKSKLPPNPRLRDRIVYGLQWFFSRLVVEIPGKPILSGVVSSVLLLIPTAAVAGAIIATVTLIFHR